MDYTPVPCYFCGKIPNVKRKFGRFFVFCKSKGCLLCINPSELTKGSATKKKAVRRWNRKMARIFFLLGGDRK